eukprot:GILI01035545.1.p1 GENE.GILI01035545.1~~GILI01035545.1.p1  ORF type:complete len:126 (-),score=12.62 GILI01035545.1:51-428(-)
MSVGGFCRASCSGFQSLRSECLDNPCLADNLCKTDVANGATISDCAEWCCVSHSGAVFFMVIFICMGLFFAAVSYYMYGLHKENVALGVIKEDGSKIDQNAVVEKPKTERQLRLEEVSKRNFVFL